MQHLNGNILCVIDTETTGLIAGFHDIIQVAVVPLGPDLRPLKEINGVTLVPFYMDLKPKRPENAVPEALRKNGRNLADLLANGMEPFKAADLFEEWVLRLNLPFRKKIVPLGQNYGFDKNFLIDWLGHETYSQFFDYHCRDTSTIANFLNDRAAFQMEAAPFPKINLAYLASQLGIAHDRAHDALGDCLVTAEVYRRMCQTHLIPASTVEQQPESSSGQSSTAV